MKECTVYFYEKETNMLLDEFIIDYKEVSDIYDFVDRVIHDYNVPYNKIGYITDY